MRPTSDPRSSAAKEMELKLVEEISILQRRLELMGMDGDCAYEHAISRLYEAMVEERKRQLTALQITYFSI
jgi:hypothetical protein